MSNVEFNEPRFVKPSMGNTLDIYFAEKKVTPIFENTEESIVANKGENEKKIKARFVKDHKINSKDIISYTPEKTFKTAVGGENILIKYKKKVRDEVSFPKIETTKIKQKIWIVAVCNGQNGTLSVEILENKQTNSTAIYEGSVKFLVGEEEKTKIEFDLSKDKTSEPNIFAKEIKLQPKSNDDVKLLLDKYKERPDKKSFHFIKASVSGNDEEIIYPDNSTEFLNKDAKRLEVLGVPCYCGVDFTAEQIQEFYKKSNGNVKSLFTADNCPLPADKKTYKEFTQELNAAMKSYEINTCIRKAHFLAQIEAETFFDTTLEYASGWDYDHTTHLENYNNYKLYLANVSNPKNPYKNFGTKAIKRGHDRYLECIEHGHDVKGHGPKYKGRGLIQLTWKDTYEAYFNKLAKSTLITTPEVVANDLNMVCDSAAWYWKERSSWGNLNNYADNDDFISVSVGVNGGLNGFEHRKSNLKKILKTLQTKETCINIDKITKVIGEYKYETSGIRNKQWGKKNKSKIEAYDD